jgi:hypothetical protein
MAVAMKTGLPPDCTLSSGYVVRLVALDSSGNSVANVNLSNISFFVTDLISGAASSLDETPNPLLVPLDETA